MRDHAKNPAPRHGVFALPTWVAKVILLTMWMSLVAYACTKISKPVPATQVRHSLGR